MTRTLCERIIHDHYGGELRVSSMTPVHGGDCSDAYRAVLSDGTKLFVKENSARNYGFFEK